MNRFDVLSRLARLILTASIITIGLIACSEVDDGETGPTGLPGPPGPITASSAESLDITIDSVTINSAPVVRLSAKNEDGVPFVGIRAGNLSFTIAKLVPGTDGNPNNWQSYINSTETATVGVGPGSGNTAVQATRESNGTLVNHNDGTYTYTFNTNVTNVTTPLAVSYDPTLTHRVAIQVGGGLPVSNPIYTFRPSDGATSGILTRDIVKIESCNECHNKLAFHGGGRIDTKYCVTCHNPGSTDANSGNTVDFKAMIHKIHRGEDLPSVVAGGEYAIWGFRDTKHDYSDVVLPQDIRNCSKCHDGADPATPQGNNWKTQLSIETCGSCHDDIDFSKDGSGDPPIDPDGHPGGIVSDNSECITCHATNRVAKSVEQSHVIPEKVASAKFKYNILEICGTAVDADPVCAPNSTPTVKFSVSDPTGATTHGYGNNYDVAGPTLADRDPEFGTSASLNILTGWNTRDYTNKDGAGSRPSRANSLAAITNAVDNTDGTFTITLAAIPGTVTGSGVVAMEGHPRGQSDPVTEPLVFDISVPVKGEVAYFGITDTTPVARRVAVDLETKCDKCHDQLSIHGNNRAENAQLCVICHNPRGTDVSRRPKTIDGIPDISATLDGKREESVDFKRLIHAIHAAQKDDPATPAVEGHGFREKGIVVYGFGNRAHDYSHVRFPGILNDCTTCHNDGTYELTGIWQTPTQNGILASTMLAEPTATDALTYTSQLLDQTNDLTISPAAAVCSACHDSALAQAHMETIGGATFNALQPSIGTYESCAVCHGPGRSADVKVVHGVE